MVKVAPSLLAADFSCLQDEIRKVEAGGADIIHVDIMDGHFVPNLTMGPFIVETVRKVTSLFIDVHLMIQSPEKFIDKFASAGAENITVHLEACQDRLESILAQIENAGVHKGVSIKPGTPGGSVTVLKGMIDLLLIMSVEPGFGGQAFIEESLEKITETKSILGDAVEIEVDGGITVDNAHKVVAAGADILVAGTAVFKAPDPAEAIKKIRGET
jgi:ribulose-phosphate 3-epimerase